MFSQHSNEIDYCYPAWTNIGMLKKQVVNHKSLRTNMVHRGFTTTSGMTQNRARVKLFFIWTYIILQTYFAKESCCKQQNDLLLSWSDFLLNLKTTSKSIV